MNLIQLIQEDLPLTDFEIRILLLTAPSRYKLHEIDKRNNRGKRLIAQPTAEIKTLQRWAINKFAGLLPVHVAATAYRQGSSIKKHASMHASSMYLLKMDFKDFFPTIKASDFIKHATTYIDLEPVDIKHLANLFFRRDKKTNDLILSIGAPSSPIISNTIMFKFDEIVADYCNIRNINYSRYADDIAISSNQPKVLDDAFNYINKLCKTISYPDLIINQEKTVFTSKKFHRQLTGLVLSNDGKASLGREKKRLIRATAYNFSKGLLTDIEVNRLKGMLAFAYSIDPKFVNTIQIMIGEQVFQELNNWHV
jgi:RNA-directed DNA polymerase